jgi:hypothetical protein
MFENALDGSDAHRRHTPGRLLCVRRGLDDQAVTAYQLRCGAAAALL